MADERDRERREGWEGRLRQGWEGRGREDWGEQRGEWGREYWPRERWGEHREGWGGRPGWGGGSEHSYRGRGEWGGEGRWGREGGWGGEGGEAGREGSFGGPMSYYGAGYGGGYGGGLGYGQQQRGRYAGRGPRNYQRPDERIRDDVNEQLTRHPDIDAFEIDVQVSAGEVTLAGTVESREMKRMAEDVADNVFGVKEVHNQIRVQHQPVMVGQGQRENR